MCKFYDVVALVRVYDEDYGMSVINVDSTISINVEDSSDILIGVAAFLNDLFNHSITEILSLNIELNDY